MFLAAVQRTGVSHRHRGSLDTPRYQELEASESGLSIQIALYFNGRTSSALVWVVNTPELSSGYLSLPAQLLSSERNLGNAGIYPPALIRDDTPRIKVHFSLVPIG